MLKPQSYLCHLLRWQSGRDNLVASTRKYYIIDQKVLATVLRDSIDCLLGREVTYIGWFLAGAGTGLDEARH